MEEAQISNQEENQNDLEIRNYMPEKTERWKAALKLQRGNPARLLKAINPNEAQLLEAAAKVHLRFRLGGEDQCDINSFAPRDYSVIQRVNLLQHQYQKIPTLIPKLHTSNIYNKEISNRKDGIQELINNGWRPISHKVLNKTDQLEIFSGNKIKYYHFKKDKRTEKSLRKKRVNKLRWLQNMYKNARKEEEEEEQKTKQNQNNQNNEDEQQEKEEEYDRYEDEDDQDYLDIPKDYNPLKDEKFMELDDEEFDIEVKDLIEWSNNLDYDSYVKEWFQLSTSNASENFVSQIVNSNSTLSSTMIENNLYSKNKLNKQQNYNQSLNLNQNSSLNTQNNINLSNTLQKNP